MRIRHYVHFGLYSRRITAATMTARLLLEPDSFSVGSRTELEAASRQHSWRIECRTPGLDIGTQVTRVLDRLRPSMDRVIALAEEVARLESGDGARLSIVRYYNDARGEPIEPSRSPVAGSRWIGGTGSRLLGWNLDRSVLDFLAATGADLDVDEYA